MQMLIYLPHFFSSRFFSPAPPATTLAPLVTIVSPFWDKSLKICICVVLFINASKLPVNAGSVQQLFFIPGVMIFGER